MKLAAEGASSPEIIQAPDLRSPSRIQHVGRDFIRVFLNPLSTQELGGPIYYLDARLPL